MTTAQKLAAMVISGTTSTRSEFKPGGAVPEHVKVFFAEHPEKFAAPRSLDQQVEHLTRISKAGLDRKDAEEMAWLLWRARIVLRYSKADWAQSVESAWLRDELFQACAAKRKSSIEDSNARRERLESTVFEGAEPVNLLKPHGDVQHEEQQVLGKTAEEDVSVLPSRAETVKLEIERLDEQFTSGLLTQEKYAEYKQDALDSLKD